MSLKIVGSRRFFPLFLTQFFGALNDNFFKNALVIMITFRGVQVASLEPNMVVALSGGIFILPFFLFSGTAGQLADKHDKGSLIRITKLLELLVMSVAAAGFLLGNFPMLLAVLFFMGAQSTIFGPLKYGILPNLVSESDLVSANAYVETGTFIAILLGTIAGGAATLLDGGEFIVIVCLLTIALLGIVSSRFIPSIPSLTPDLEVDWTFARSTLSILRAVRHNRPIMNSILGISWFWFLGAGILSVLPGFVKDVLHGGEEVVTAFLALFTVGIGVGSFLCEKLSFRRVEVGVIPFGAVGMSLFLTDLFYTGAVWSAAPAGPGEFFQLAGFLASDGSWRVMIDFFMTAVWGGMFIVPLYCFIQFRGEPAQLSRIIAANNIVNALFMVAAALITTGLFALDVTIPQIFGLLAVVNIGVSVYIYSLVPEFTLRFLGWMLAHVMYRIRVEGAENIPREGAAVLVCNHVTYIDWLIIFSECKRPARFVMDHRIFTFPVINLLGRHAKVIPIAPAKEDPAIMESAFEKVSGELREGEVVGIFPEGFLTRDGEMAYFRPGIERIIGKDLVPVVPMALHGLWGSFFSHAPKKGIFRSIFRWRREVVLHIGNAVDPGDVTAAHLESVVRTLLEKAAATSG